MEIEVYKDKKDEAKAVADACMSFKPVVTDWEHEYMNPQPLEAMVAAMQKLEPLPLNRSKHHEAYILQNRIRIAARAAKGLPLFSERKCGYCVKNKIDGSLWGDPICLWCDERKEQLFDFGSRGNMEYIKPQFDHRSGTWGILYYLDRNDNVIMFFIAIGFRSLRDAEDAFWPITGLKKYLDEKHNGLFETWKIGSNFFDPSWLLKMNLPLNPVEFNAFIHSQIMESVSENQDWFSQYVEAAIGSYNKER